VSESPTYQRQGAPTRDQVHTLFAQTTGYVAATARLFALGAYLGRNMTGGVGIVLFIAAFACLIGMQFAARAARRL
jgi:modulator of FtsH protease